MKKRNKYLSFYHRNKQFSNLLIAATTLGMAVAISLTLIVPAHAETSAAADQSPPSYINLTPDHGLACPDGYRPVRVTSDLSDPVILEGDVVLTYPITSGGMTCEQVRS